SHLGGVVPIYVFATFAITQHCSVSFDQNERLGLRGAPLVHIGKRMPDESLVGRDQFLGIPLSHDGYWILDSRYWMKFKRNWIEHPASASRQPFIGRLFLNYF